MTGASMRFQSFFTELKRQFLIFLWFIEEQIGISPLKILSLPVRLFKYCIRTYHFVCEYNSVSWQVKPCLHDYFDSAGAYSSEYFWQDLVAARIVNMISPANIIDIGSRIDGYIANIASSRVINCLDIRDMKVKIPNVKFFRCDICKPLDNQSLPIKRFEVVSSLHSLEHFGLGRYGDKISRNAWKIAITNMSRLCQQEGTLILSTYVGKPHIFYDSHRVFDIHQLIDELISNNFVLQKLQKINEAGAYEVEDLSQLTEGEQLVMFRCIKKA